MDAQVCSAYSQPLFSLDSIYMPATLLSYETFTYTILNVIPKYCLKYHVWQGAM